MWTTKYILSQLCVIIAVALYGSTFFVKNKKAILALVCFNSLFYGIQYALLGSYIGFVLNIISIGRCIWFYINDSKGKTKDYVSLIVCNTLFIVAGALSYKNPMDIIPIINHIVFCYMVWQPSIAVYRYIAPVYSVSWMCYNIYLKSIMSVITESIMIIIAIVSIINYRKSLKNKEITKENQELPPS